MRAYTALVRTPPHTRRTRRRTSVVVRLVMSLLQYALRASRIHARRIRVALPDAAHRLIHHLRVRRATERLLELRHVRDDADRPEAARRMRVRRGVHARDGVRAVLAPHLPPADEEPLLRRVTVGVWKARGLHLLHQRHPSEAHAAVVADVL